MRCKTCHFAICRCDDLAAGFMGQAHTKKCWPMSSDAMAVHPDQIQEAMDRNKAHGVSGVTYDPKTGQAILADRKARKELMRLEGVIDRSGGYGDTYNGKSPMPEIDDGGWADV